MKRLAVLWRLAVVAVVVGVVAVGVAACGSDSKDDGGSAGTTSGGSATTAEKGPIVIGMPIGMSGFLVNYDGPFLEGAKIAVADVNAKGGVLGRKLEIVTSDTHSDINQGTRAALDVIDKGAEFVLPSVDYDFGGAAARAAQKAGKVAVSTAGNPLFGKTGIGDLFFNVFGATPTEGAAAVKFVRETLKAQNPYILVDTSISYGKQYEAAFKFAWKDQGGTGDVPGDTFENGDPSIAAQINRLKSASPTPDVIILDSYPPGGGSAIRQLRAAGITAPIVTNNSFDGVFWLPSVPNEANTYLTTTGIPTPGADPDPDRKAFFEKFAEQTGKPAVGGNHALAGYASVQALSIAIDRAKSTDAQAVKDALEQFKDEKLIEGPVTWTPECHVSLGSPFVIAKVDKGKLTYVTTITPDKVQPSTC